jgi:hypothetical protein
MLDSHALLSEAKKYWQNNLNVIPCNQGKYPMGERWSVYSERMISESEFKSIANGHAYGIGVVCGKVSGNLEVIDIDNKYDITGKLVTDYFQLISDNNPELFDKLHIVKTPSNGYHLYYRCQTITGNQKLARRYSTEDELKEKPKEKVKVLIETRGQGGFLVCPPTKDYTWFQERVIPEISESERSFLFEAARPFNEVYEIVQAKPEKTFDKVNSPFEITPWDDYNDHGDVISLLESHGWTVDSRYKREDRIYLIRPGKTKGHSADYLISKGLFKCWSTSESDFVTEKAYNKSAVFTILECNGDFSAAAKRLEEQGYGKRNPPKQYDYTSSLNQIGEAEEPEKPKQLSDFDHLLVTKEKDIPREEPVITICGASFAAPHNISMISAAPKGAKTAVNNVMVSCSISEDGEANGFPDIKAKINTEKKAVVLFDTEQSEADQQYNVSTIVRRAGLDQTPDHLRCYNIRRLDFKAYKEATDTICSLCAEKFGGIHSIYVDGGADYIASVNDEEQSTEIIQWFTHLAIRYDCPVIIVVHQNPGGNKERGHFGSTGQRKCYGLIEIIKEGDTFTLQPKMMRRAGNTDIPLVQFSYSAAQGYHVQVDVPDKEMAKAIREREHLKEVASKVFPAMTSFSHKDSISRIMDTTNKKHSSAKTMLQNMVGFQYIEKGVDGNYRLNITKVNLGQNGSKEET